MSEYNACDAELDQTMTAAEVAEALNTLRLAASGRAAPSASTARCAIISSPLCGSGIARRADTETFARKHPHMLSVRDGHWMDTGYPATC